MFAANVARNGMVALTYDPIGQGERLQAVDPATQASRIGRPTGEHGHASIKTMLMGEHIARYFVWDAIRAIDYLVARDDVDGEKIGAFGCSGGGVVTAMLAAFDHARRRRSAGLLHHLVRGPATHRRPAGSRTVHPGLHRGWTRLSVTGCLLAAPRALLRGRVDDR